nr:hypothetical protein [uncultured Brevundimonas sp.]
MFDAARIRSTPLTDKLGYGGVEGVIFGVTTVSMTGVEVIGEPEDDCALNVDFEGRLAAAWFQPSLVEVIGSPEMTMTIGNTTLTRSADSDVWIDAAVRPWWKFWV